MVTEADWQRWTAADLTPYLDVALESFGPRRSMIGSDWPVCTLAADHARVVGVVADFIAPLSAEEKSAVFGRTAASFYRLA